MTISASTPRLGASVLPRWETTIQVTRRVAGTYVNGRYQPDPSPVVLDVAAVVQVIRPEEMEEASEGRRTGEGIAIWTETQLYPVQAPVSAPAGRQPDLVAYEGETYQVDSERDWNVLGGYRKYIAAKAGQ